MMNLNDRPLSDGRRHLQYSWQWLPWSGNQSQPDKTLPHTMIDDSL